MESLKDIQPTANAESIKGRVIKKARGARRRFEGEAQQSTSQGNTAEQPILVRVKRTRQSEPIEQLEMEFDTNTNALKRRKLISQSEALTDQFSKACNLNESIEQKHQQQENGFTLGKYKKEEASKHNSHVVVLRKLMPTQLSRSEKEIKEYHQNLIEQQRKRRREEILKQKRTPKAQSTPQLTFKLHEHQEETKQIQLEERKTESLNGITVIDLEALAKGEQMELDGQSDWDDYDYFLCVRKEGLLYDPFSTARDQAIDFEDPEGDCESRDSEDSNRESASQNDYPDEEDERQEGYGYGSESSDDDFGYGGYPKRKNRKLDSSSDIDEEEAARRYNNKQKKGLANWLDRVQRKMKTGATQMSTLKQRLYEHDGSSSDEDIQDEVMHPELDSEGRRNSSQEDY